MNQRLQSARLALISLGIAAAVASAPPAAPAATIQIPPSRDNTLYEDASGGLSNGAGSYFFVGQAGGKRRGLLAFDVAGNVPAGSLILGVQLTLHCSRAPFSSPPPIDCTLQRVLADWGEAGSNAGEPGGSGAAAQTGDATWIHRFYPSTTWTTPGGDFVAGASGSFTVVGIGTYTVGSTPEMVADVQGWLDAPGSSFGWIVLGQEGGATSNARRFDSRENSLATVRPVLRIDYEPAQVGTEIGTWSRLKGIFR